jgi:hypothetical protein
MPVATPYEGEASYYAPLRATSTAPAAFPNW